MRLRFVVCCLLIASCEKAEPTESSHASNELKKIVEAPIPAKRQPPTQPQTVPSLPEHTDANPPNVPRLTGPIHNENGLEYIDEVVGTGAAPEKGNTVKVHYTGWLTDGTKFDSSRDRGDPIAIRFDSGMVIKGWDLGLASMRVGGKRRLIIPSELGYGAGGAGDRIPPDAVLVFDVELVDLE